jgi:YbgC/YbaW family acyl-CoA thioester hydrolase
MREISMFRTEFIIEWGDCDEAGIVFYPNYFYWFDCTFQRLLRERELGQRELKRRFGVVTPLVDVGARFLGPATHDDVLRVDACVEVWETKRFRMSYKLSVENKPVADGFEVRAWANIDASGRMSGVPVDEAFRSLMKSH